MGQVVKLKAEHIAALHAKGAIEYLTDYVTEDSLRRIEGMPYAWTYLDGAGEPRACIGFFVFWKGRAEGWAFFDPECRREFLGIHKAFRTLIYSVPIRRIEATIRTDFTQGHRWAKLLGFEMEAPRMRSYTVDGKDMALYSLIQEQY